MNLFLNIKQKLLDIVKEIKDMEKVSFTEQIEKKDKIVNVLDRNVDKADLQKVLDRLYKCRDLEITNLWQRSVFLSAFLLLCFSGYGYLISKLIDCSTDQNIIRLHFVCFIVAIIAAIVSLLYILMAKASKAWYEVYENAITEFEKKYKNFLGIPKEYIMGAMDHDKDNISDKIFGQQAGPFSPSKINIVIGQVCFVLWIVIMGFHFISFFISWLFAFCENVSLQNKLLLEIIGMVFVIILFSVWFSILGIEKIKNSCHSSHLCQDEQS